jgi:mRNA interferase RelE/StbE
MKYSVGITSVAAKQIKKLPRPIRGRILDAIEALEDNPFPPNSTKLVDEDFAWRLRIGDYRVIYEIYDAELVVSVMRAGHRREIYKRR